MGDQVKLEDLKFTDKLEEADADTVYLPPVNILAALPFGLRLNQYMRRGELPPEFECAKIETSPDPSSP